MASPFGWLHLTDLHQGMTEEGWLWPSVREELFADLERLHQKSGPWDVVFFTGDLTQRGSDDEFAALGKTLDRLWKKLAALGSRPVLLAVPGNHDLVRPDPDSAEVLFLDLWPTRPKLRDTFFRDGQSSYRKTVSDAFAPYTKWWNALGTDPRVTLNPGLLPGDYSATLEKEGLRLGVVGLNTSFLQLTGGDYRGKLALDPRQLSAACSGDVADFTAAHDVAFLLTHHPPEWLDAAALADYRAEIYKPGRFALHLYGHMHVADGRSQSEGGALPRRMLQGASLFGREQWPDGKVERIHGYSAGRLSLDGTAATLRIWPRIAGLTHAGHRTLDRDTGFVLDDGGSYGDSFAIRRAVVEAPPPRVDAPASTSALGGAASSPPPDKRAARTPVKPGGQYDPKWHIPRPRAEQDAIAYLRTPGTPAVLWGPRQFGKSWLLAQLIDGLLHSGETPMWSARVSLGDIGQSERADYDLFLRRIATKIAEELELPDERVAAAWDPGKPSPQDRLRRFVSDTLTYRRIPVIVAFDDADAIADCAFSEDFFSMLRSWAENPKKPWPKLRLLLAVSTTPLKLTADPHKSVFMSLSEPIRLDELDPLQVSALAKLYGLSWTGGEVAALMTLVGGHPYLVRAALYEIAVHHAPLADLVSGKIASPFETHLHECRRLLQTSPELAAEFRRLASSSAARLLPFAYEPLQGAGLIVSDGAACRLRCRLYERLL